MPAHTLAFLGPMGCVQMAIPLTTESDYNAVTRSEVTDTTAWSWRYDEGTLDNLGAFDNGLFRSTLLDRESNAWLEQPGIQRSQMKAFDSWTQGPYVYLGFEETDLGTGQTTARLARLCREEGTAPDYNLLSSFVKLDLVCSSDRPFSLDQITGIGAGTSDLRAQLIYVAFRSRPAAEDPITGIGICAFAYGNRGGVDYEIDSRIDTALNPPGGSGFHGTDGLAFSCLRSTSVPASETFPLGELDGEGGGGVVGWKCVASPSDGAVVWMLPFCESQSLSVSLSPLCLSVSLSLSPMFNPSDDH